LKHLQPFPLNAGDFAKRHRYTQRAKLPACFARLQRSQPEASQSTILAYESQAVRLARLALHQVQDKVATLREIDDLFAGHPDYPVFTSLPGAGKFLAPALLAKFGDDRTRFPTPQVLQSVAGTCPVTKASGKSKLIMFRQACDRDFRTTVQQWAKSPAARGKGIPEKLGMGKHLLSGRPPTLLFAQ